MTESTCVVGEHPWAGIPHTASVWLRVPHPLWAFALLPISSPTIVALLVSRSTLLYFLFLSHFLQFPYFPFCPALPLPKSCWACSLQVPPPVYFPTSLYPFLSCTFFHSSISFSRTFLSSRTSHFCPAFPLPRSCLACPFQVPPPAYFLLFPFTLPSRTSLYCGFYLDLWILTLLCLQRVFLPPFFYWNFPEMYLNLSICFLLIWLLFIYCCRFCFKFNASFVPVCIFVLI